MPDAKELLKQFEPKEVKVLKTERQVCAVRFSPCAKFLVGGCFDGLVRRWDLSQDAIPEMAPLSGHGGWVQSVAFHPSEPFVYSVDSWGQLCAWPVAEEKPEPKWKVAEAHNGWVRSVAVNSDGKHVATGGADKKVRLWSSADGNLSREIDAGEDVFCILFHPDGKSFVTGDFKGTIQQWDIDSGQSVRKFDAAVLNKVNRLQDVGGIRCLAFDASGATLAVGGTKPENGGNVQGIPSVLLFDWASGELKTTLTLGANGDVYVCDTSFHPQGFLMAVTSGNPGAGKLVYQRPEDNAPFFETKKMANCHSLALHPNGRRIAVVATNAGSNGNGRRIGKTGDYPGNWSPIHLLDMPASQS